MWKLNKKHHGGNQLFRYEIGRRWESYLSVSRVIRNRKGWVKVFLILKYGLQKRGNWKVEGMLNIRSSVRKVHLFSGIAQCRAANKHRSLDID